MNEIDKKVETLIARVETRLQSLLNSHQRHGNESRPSARPEGTYRVNRSKSHPFRGTDDTSRVPSTLQSCRSNASIRSPVDASVFQRTRNLSNRTRLGQSHNVSEGSRVQIISRSNESGRVRDPDGTINFSGRPCNRNMVRRHQTCSATSQIFDENIVNFDYSFDRNQSLPRAARRQPINLREGKHMIQNLGYIVGSMRNLRAALAVTNIPGLFDSSCRSE